MKLKLFIIFGLIILFFLSNNIIVQALSIEKNSQLYLFHQKCPVSGRYDCTEEEVATELSDLIVSRIIDEIIIQCNNATDSFSCAQLFINNNLYEIKKTTKDQLKLKKASQTIIDKTIKKISHDLLAYVDPIDFAAREYREARLATATTTTVPSQGTDAPFTIPASSESSSISNLFFTIRKNQMQSITIIISFTLIILSIVYVFYKRIQHNNDFKFMQFEHNAELDKYKVYELSKTQMDQDYDVKLKQVEYDKSIKDRDFMMIVTKEERDYMLKQRELDIKENKNPNQLMDVIEQNKDVQFRIKK